MSIKDLDSGSTCYPVYIQPLVLHPWQSLQLAEKEKKRKNSKQEPQRETQNKSNREKL